MDGETSPFESSEMLASFLASTRLLSESWKLCSHANAAAPNSFVSNTIGDVTYVAFSGVQTVAGLDLGCRRSHLVAFETAAAGTFPALQRYGGEAEEPAMVHAGMLRLFLSLINLNFPTQMFEKTKESKFVVFTGHSLGRTMASLSAMWLLSHPQSTTTVLCITFGTPLLGNVSLSRAILQERWGGNFFHVVGKHDIVPRLLLAPLSPLITPHLHSLFRYWHTSLTSTGLLALELSGEEKNSLFLFVLSCVEALAKSGENLGRDDTFCPFGNYVFCTNEGAICLDNAVAVVKMLHLMLATGCASSCIEDHLNYEAYVGQVSLEFLKSCLFAEGKLPESSYEAGVTLALHSSEIDCQEPVLWGPAKDCLETAKRLGHAPNIKSANLAKVLSKFTPLRAQIEWYKASCDMSDDRMGYYDTFKLRGASKKDAKVDMNRIKLARFWDDLIQMLDTNQLPHDFHRRAKWVNASQFYKLLVEPLDIAEYYRTGMHQVKGHYAKYGRERRYKVFDTWWSNRKVGEEENNQRNRYASLTQDSCFWAHVEEAREWIENVRSESDSRKLTLLWENIEKFEQYARSLHQKKEVSIDVLLENSSYSLWIKGLTELRTQLQQFSPCSID